MYKSLKDMEITNYHIRAIFIAYALVGAQASCLPVVCVAYLGVLDDAILLLSLLLFCTSETVPPVWGAVKEQALGQSFTLCSFDLQTNKHLSISNTLFYVSSHNVCNRDELVLSMNLLVKGFVGCNTCQ